MDKPQVEGKGKGYSQEAGNVNVNVDKGEGFRKPGMDQENLGNPDRAGMIGQQGGDLEKGGDATWKKTQKEGVQTSDLGKKQYYNDPIPAREERRNLSDTGRDAGSFKGDQPRGDIGNIEPRTGGNQKPSNR